MGLGIWNKYLFEISGENTKETHEHMDVPNRKDGSTEQNCQRSVSKLHLCGINKNSMSPFKTVIFPADLVILYELEA